MAENKNQKKIDAAITGELFDENERILIWITQNWKKIAAATVLLLAALALYLGIRSWQQRQERLGAEAIGSANTVAELRGALTKHAGHNAALNGRLRLTKLLIGEKKYDEAIRELSPISTEPAARLLKGYTLELKKDYKNAVAEFDALFNDPAQSPVVRAEAKYASGRLHILLKELKKAQSVLKIAVASQSMAARQWESSSAKLLLQLENGDFGALK